MILSGYEYTASAGQTADSIAREIYGAERYAAELLCANPEQCGKIRMDGGEKWQLPVIEIPSEDQKGIPQKAPWEED